MQISGKIRLNDSAPPNYFEKFSKEGIYIGAGSFLNCRDLRIGINTQIRGPIIVKGTRSYLKKNLDIM